MAKNRLTTADLIVLSLLCERPMHGYEIVATLEQRDFEDWAPISRPQVYYSLRKLAKSGQILPTADRTGSQGPDRVVYKPSGKARQQMKQALGDSRWSQQRPPPPFVTWVALARNTDRETIDVQISRRRSFLKSEIEREQLTLARFDDTVGEGVRIGRALVRLVIEQFQSELAALDEIRAALLSPRRGSGS